jgi:integrase-like protein
MIEDMAIRNMSPNTQKAYIRAVKNFSLHFGKSPDKLTFEHVREYQLHLASRGLQAATIIPLLGPPDGMSAAAVRLLAARLERQRWLLGRRRIGVVRGAHRV